MSIPWPSLSAFTTYIAFSKCKKQVKKEIVSSFSGKALGYPHSEVQIKKLHADLPLKNRTIQSGKIHAPNSPRLGSASKAPHTNTISGTTRGGGSHLQCIFLFSRAENCVMYCQLIIQSELTSRDHPERHFPPYPS